jgi:ArsR family transcriptional regulator, virulence genes transcriptional regulator
MLSRMTDQPNPLADPISLVSTPTALPADFEVKAASAAQLLRALSHEKRLLILCHIGAGEMSVGALQNVIGLSQSALSQHLAVLRTEGLVATRRQSQTIYYAIANPAVITIISTLQSVFCPELDQSPSSSH